MDTQYNYYIVGFIIICYLQYYILAFYWKISLKGKAILITGCDTGIGNSTAKALDKMDCIVFATCLNKETADLLNKETSNNTIVKLMDVTNVEQIKSVATEISQYLDSKNSYLYGVVNNSGIVEVSPFECIAPAMVNKVMEVNYVGMTNVIRAFLPLMRNTKYNKYLSKKYASNFFGLFNRGQAGRIVNIASVAGNVTLPWLSAYCASKHAVMGLCGCLRYEFNKYLNVWLSTVEPSFTGTPFLTHSLNTAERSRKTWRKLENSKELMKCYNLEEFIHNIENRDTLIKLATNYDISKVVNVITAGLQSRFPLKHYYPTWSGWITVQLYRITPSCIFDFILEKLSMSK